MIQLQWFKSYLLAGLVTLHYLNPAMPNAAEVPPGVVLAKEQRIVINNPDPNSLDPHKASQRVEFQVIEDLFEGLIARGVDGGLVPGVAERWTASEDFKTWTFYLRPSARWSNGDPVTAHDFVYSWRRLCDPKTGSPYNSYLATDVQLQSAEEIGQGQESVESLGVEALNAHTLRLHLKCPNTELIQMLAFSVMVPVHAGMLKSHGESWTRAGYLVGNGAFRLVDRRIGERLRLVPNEHYWEKEKTLLSEVVYLANSDPTADVGRYFAGEIDVNLQPLSTELYEKNKYRCEHFRFQKELWVDFISFNQEHIPALRDQRVRQALYWSIDRETLVKRIRRFGDIEAYGVVPTLMEGSQEVSLEYASWSKEKRLAMAKQRLLEAGYSPKNPLKLEMLYYDLETRAALLASIEMWKRLGCVQINLVEKDRKGFFSSYLKGGFQLAKAGWGADYISPRTMLTMWHSKSSVNRSGYKSAQFDSCLERAIEATSLEAQRLAYQQADTCLATEAACIPLFFPTCVRLVKPYVGGFENRSGIARFLSKHLYIVAH